MFKNLKLKNWWGKTLAGDYFIYPPSPAPILSFLASRGKGLLESSGGGGWKGGLQFGRGWRGIKDIMDIILRCATKWTFDNDKGIQLKNVQICNRLLPLKE